MFRIGTGIFSDKIHLETIDYLNNLLSFSMKNLPSLKNPNCTKNGYQTANIITYLNDSYKKEILKKHFDIKDLHHVHLIHYYSNGYQQLHDHKRTEKYSFIVYLNDADGDTVVYLKNNKEYRITPKKGKIVYFPAHLSHEGLLSTSNKRVAVGALQPK
jgi:glycogen synthase|tara:strand:+ start:119 stop:592 length:474 start_codon:yes stop_codon:yes gene_type:complete